MTDSFEIAVVYLVQFPVRRGVRRRLEWVTDLNYGAHLTLEAAQVAAEVAAPHWKSTFRDGRGKTAYRIDGVPLWRLVLVVVDP